MEIGGGRGVNYDVQAIIPTLFRLLSFKAVVHLAKPQNVPNE